ncbi:MAG TPA: DinB family protein [Fimbriimonadaceae bacterium]|jgi:hypothetical protein
MESYVDLCKKLAVEGMEGFLKVFSFVPDDKLTWTPAPTAKSALHIGAHTALYSGRFARMIGDKKLPEIDNIEEWVRQRTERELAVTSRAEVERIFRAGTDEVIASLESLTAEDIELQLESKFGPSASMRWLMRLPGIHAESHTGQIDYLQTCWDDQVVHF